MSALAVSLEAVQEARRNLAGIALRTPTVPLNAEAGAEAWLKLENLQPIGSFKLRGAANAMAHTPKAERERGLVTASAGNMAQGVAYCARRAGVSATVIAPDTAPATKLRAVERLGGRVILAPFADWWRAFETRSFPGVSGTFVHAFDDENVMAGNGTIALELLEDVKDLEAVTIPWGGGGLACGIASVLRAVAPTVRIYAAEIETAAPLSASLAAGQVTEVAHQPSFVDGIGARTVFPNMFAHAQSLLDGSVVVTVDEAKAAMKLAAERNRVIVEGAGACAIAAAISGRAGHGKVAAIVSGGNINLDTFAGVVV